MPYLSCGDCCECACSNPFLHKLVYHNVPHQLGKLAVPHRLHKHGSDCFSQNDKCFCILTCQESSFSATSGCSSRKPSAPRAPEPVPRQWRSITNLPQCFTDPTRMHMLSAKAACMAPQCIQGAVAFYKKNGRGWLEVLQRLFHSTEAYEKPGIFHEFWTRAWDEEHPLPRGPCKRRERVQSL